MVGTLEEPAAIACLSDDHKGGMKENRRPIPDICAPQKQPFNVAQLPVISRGSEYLLPLVV